MLILHVTHIVGRGQLQDTQLESKDTYQHLDNNTA
jgi:hypothetical protein